MSSPIGRPSSSSLARKSPAESSSSFSPDFAEWLGRHGYQGFEFAQAARPGFGGKASAGQVLKRRPVIFVHGNADSAKGWNKVRAEYLKAGYQASELYALSWGKRNPLQAHQQHHDLKTLLEIRAFIEAVKAYTGAAEVDVVSHSMGVTLARKAIEGGRVVGASGADLGPPLTGQVKNFLGIAGANRGLAAAAWTGDAFLTTNRQTGFHPQSEFLQQINSTPGDEGKNIVSFFSLADPLIGWSLFGPDSPRTCPIPGESGQHRYWAYGHLGVRDLTTKDQLAELSKY